MGQPFIFQAHLCPVAGWETSEEVACRARHDPHACSSCRHPGPRPTIWPLLENVDPCPASRTCGTDKHMPDKVTGSCSPVISHYTVLGVSHKVFMTSKVADFP